MDDPLYLPGRFALADLAVNPPSCGWDSLFKQEGIEAHVPASFEELFGGGNPAWRYHGVGWFATEVEIPSSWSGQVVQLTVAKVRLRLEVYVNGSLAGYDLVAETPYSVDITSHLHIAAKNRIALRLTNPGGQRGWNDSPSATWGKHSLPPGHDFGGIGGDVTLTATAPVRLGDLWVKNLLPAGGRRIEVQANVQNPTAQPQRLSARIEIAAWSREGTTAPIQRAEIALLAPAQAGTPLRHILDVPSATLWSPDSPALYVAKVSVSNEDTGAVIDETTTRFGFRVFEAKENAAGDHHYYLNGQRIRLRSAIDWGYYSGGGFYPTPEQARRSIEAVKAVGHNTLNFHRRIGEPLVMDAADELGVLIYEEPGGAPGVSELRTPSWIEQNPKEAAYLSSQLFPEKFARMVRRDRPHPSVVIWSIGNELCTYDYVHKRIFQEARALDDSRLLVNQSGGQYGGDSGPIPHYRPYEARPRLDYIDNHTVDSQARFPDSDLHSHRDPVSDSLHFWGEVRCVTGPDNWPLLARTGHDAGYDGTAYRAMAEELAQYHARNRLAATTASRIATPADLVRQAARGLMYADGRLGQSIMSSDAEDGYAINGWSGGDPELNDDFLGWSSAICDVDRNLKGSAADLRVWNRDLQVALFRRNGKYFRPGDTAELECVLINEHRLLPGHFRLRITVTDGSGAITPFKYEQEVEVAGGDVFAQPLAAALPVKLLPEWHAGYITVRGELLDSTSVVVADGEEQVLYQNRPSWRTVLGTREVCVLDWPAAQRALTEAGIPSVSLEESQIILAAGTPPTAPVWAALTRRLEAGATLLVRFDAAWAEACLRAQWLTQPVTRWGGEQKGFWNGNGWGYLDGVRGTQAHPHGRAVGTNGWEVPGDPVGFAPFSAAAEQTSRGALISRPDQVLTLIGEFRVGTGRVILAPSYPVDADNAFNDLVFFNLLTSEADRTL